MIQPKTKERIENAMFSLILFGGIFTFMGLELTVRSIWNGEDLVEFALYLSLISAIVMCIGIRILFNPTFEQVKNKLKAWSLNPMVWVLVIMTLGSIWFD